LAGIYRLLRWDHPHKIIPATELRKMSLRWVAP
jgi:hypothetical protein